MQNNVEYDTVMLLKTGLERIQQQHNVTDEEISVQPYRGGCYSINIKGEPLYWFADVHELIEELSNGTTSNPN